MIFENFCYYAFEFEMRFLKRNIIFNWCAISTRTCKFIEFDNKRVVIKNKIFLTFDFFNLKTNNKIFIVLLSKNDFKSFSTYTRNIWKKLFNNFFSEKHLNNVNDLMNWNKWHCSLTKNLCLNYVKKRNNKTWKFVEFNNF